MHATHMHICGIVEKFKNCTFGMRQQASSVLPIYFARLFERRRRQQKNVSLFFSLHTFLGHFAHDIHKLVFVLHKVVSIANKNNTKKIDTKIIYYFFLLKIFDKLLSSLQYILLTKNIYIFYCRFDI